MCWCWRRRRTAGTCGREELLELLEFADEEPLLDDRRCVFHRRVPRRPDAPRLRANGCSANRRGRGRRTGRGRRSRLSLSDRELPLGGWAKARCVVP